MFSYAEYMQCIQLNTYLKFDKLKQRSQLTLIGEFKQI